MALPAGYSSDMFRLSDEEKRKIECSICFEVLRQAVKCSNGHCFCWECVTCWVSCRTDTSPTPTQADAPPICPTCAVSGFFSFARDVDKQIASTNVRCPKCTWEGTFDEYMRKHLSPSTTELCPTVTKKRKISTSTDESTSEDSDSDQSLAPPSQKNART